MDLAALECKELVYPGVKEGMYKIFSDGRIYSNYKKDFMTLIPDKDGYLKVILSGGSRANKVCVRVHKLILLTFKGNPPKDMIDPTVNHIDHNIKNNHIDNLEWMERVDNVKDRPNPIGEKNSQAKLTENDVKEIIKLLKNNVSLSKIGEKYNVSKSTISSIKRGKTWKHINPFFKGD